MNRSLSVALSFGILSIPGTASAEDTDVAATIAGLLSAFGQVPVTRTVGVQSQQVVCMVRLVPGNIGPFSLDCQNRSITINHQETRQEVLSASSIRVAQSNPIQIDGITQTSLPTQVTADSVSYLNCSSQTVTQQASLTVAFQRSASVAISHSVTNTIGAQASFGLHIGPVSLGGQVSIGRSDTEGNVNTSTFAQTVTQSSQVQVSLSPKSALTAQLETWPVQYVARFHTVVIIDADLSQNDRGYRSLSQIIDISKRTFPLSGAITFDDAAQAHMVTYDATFDQTQCSGNSIMTISGASQSTKTLTLRRPNN